MVTMLVSDQYALKVLSGLGQALQPAFNLPY
jgi:hypothetical protein